MHTSLPSFRRRPESSGRGPQNIDLPCMFWLFLPKTVPKSIASALLDPGFRRGDGAVEMCAYGSPLWERGRGSGRARKNQRLTPLPNPLPKGERELVCIRQPARGEGRSCSRQLVQTFKIKPNDRHPSLFNASSRLFTVRSGWCSFSRPNRPMRKLRKSAGSSHCSGTPAAVWSPRLRNFLPDWTSASAV